jgi:Calcineurin-like phosphoesterase
MSREKPVHRDIDSTCGSTCGPTQRRVQTRAMRLAAFRWLVGLAGLAGLVAMVALMPGAARAEDEPRNVETTCNHGKEYDAGLCYERCRPGYDGVGPVCWGECPDGYTDDGALCRKDAVIIPQESYGRGAGSPLGCGASEEKDGALCYPECKSGYDGVGPVCWKKCPDGYKDDGAFCRRDVSTKNANTKKCAWYDKCGLAADKGCSKCPKGYRNDGCTCWRDAHIFAKDSYGRGAGTALHTCGDGKEKDGALCYPECKSGHDGVGPVCWKPCPDGFTDDGALCRKDAHIIPKDSYGRGAGTMPPTCATPSFTKGVPPVTDRSSFTMIIASDPQFPWWDVPPKCDDEACTKRRSIQANREQIQAMNDIEKTATPGGADVTGIWPSTPALTRGGGAISKPQGVIINGDLTAFWHTWQVDLFEQYFASKGSLRWPLLPGLGNHDYDNNVDDCWWGEPLYYATQGMNGCASNARDFIKTMIHCDKVPNFPAAIVQSFDKHSLAYSWNMGSYHFVQLHNYPTYSRKQIDISSSIEWLKQDLAAATAAGRRIVLNFHDYGEHMKVKDKQFLGAIAGQNVVAVFVGHIHEDRGYVGTVPGTNIPYFRSGSSDHHTFLLVEFADTYMNVGVIDSTDGVPKFLKPDKDRYLRTVVFPASSVAAGR